MLDRFVTVSLSDTLMCASKPFTLKAGVLSAQEVAHRIAVDRNRQLENDGTGHRIVSWSAAFSLAPRIRTVYAVARCSSSLLVAAQSCRVLDFLPSTLPFPSTKDGIGLH